MKIFVPLDGSTNSLQSIDYIKKFLAIDEATTKITLFYVVMYEMYEMANPGFADISGNGKAEKVLDEAEAKIRSFNPNIQVEKVIEVGSSAADKIIEAAEAKNADMIIMGSKGTTNLKRFLLGSVSTRVSQYASCTVVLVR